MEEKKYALGMGDTDYLSDGLFDSMAEAHNEAAKLRDLPHDNGDFHKEYIIGEVVPSKVLAQKYVKPIAEDVIEMIAELMSELECFGSLDGDLIVISDAGKKKIVATLKDVLQADTTYPNASAIKCSKNFSFDD